MQEVAAGVYLLDSGVANIYLADDILIDGGTRYCWTKVEKQLLNKNITLMALTHCHPDHQGIAKKLCTARNISLACHDLDALAMEGKTPMLPNNIVIRAGEIAIGGSSYPVKHILHDGDMINNWKVIHAPGHTPGHVIYWRESDKVCIAGDLLGHTGGKLKEPAKVFSFNPQQNKESIKVMMALHPKIVCFGHGPPLNDPDWDAYIGEEFTCW
jgi:glyoxylase-like metal-dependent hydrolase (beta-lactamase superfamily II)